VNGKWKMGSGKWEVDRIEMEIGKHHSSMCNLSR
jgi:hypothetical protein